MRGRTTAVANLRFHIRTVLEILPEMADGAGDFFVFVCGEGEDGDEAEGEPWPVIIMI